MLEIKTILLPFNNHCPTEIVVDAARQILISFGGYIEGAYYRPLMPIIAAEGITLPGDFLAEFEQEGQLPIIERYILRPTLGEESLQFQKRHPVS